MYNIFEARISMPNWTKVSKRLKLPRENLQKDRWIGRQDDHISFFSPLGKHVKKKKTQTIKRLVCTYEFLSDLIKF